MYLYFTQVFLFGETLYFDSTTFQIDSITFSKTSRSFLPKRNLCCLNTLGLIWANFLNWKKGRRTHFILSVFSACLSTIQYPVKRYLIAYLIQNLQPFSVVEQPSFRDLLQDLQPNASLMSRTTLRRKIVFWFDFRLFLYLGLW